MSFQDAFASELVRAGIPIEASAVPEREVLVGDLESMESWLNDLDDDTRAGVDEMVADDSVKFALADSSDPIAPNLGSLFAAIDVAGLSIGATGIASIMRAAVDASPDDLV